MRKLLNLFESIDYHGSINFIKATCFIVYTVMFVITILPQLNVYTYLFFSPLYCHINPLLSFF